MLYKIKYKDDIQFFSLIFENYFSCFFFGVIYIKITIGKALTSRTKVTTFCSLSFFYTLLVYRFCSLLLFNFEVTSELGLKREIRRITNTCDSSQKNHYVGLLRLQ